MLVYPDIGMEVLTYYMAFARLAPVQVSIYVYIYIVYSLGGRSSAPKITRNSVFGCCLASLLVGGIYLRFQDVQL